MIEILLADDHNIFVDGIVELFSKEPEIRITSTAKTGKEVLEQVKKSSFDIILLDLFMPEMDGIVCARKLMTYKPNQKIIVLTMLDEESVVKRIMNMNIKGYVLKTAHKKELIHAIMQVQNGKEYFSPQIKKHKTKTRSQVAHLLLQGNHNILTNREI